MASPSQLALHAKKIAALQAAKKAAQAPIPSAPTIAPVTGSGLPVGTPPKSIDQMWEEAVAADNPQPPKALKAADKGSDLIHISELADYHKQKDAAAAYAQPADDLLSGATVEDIDSWLSSDTDEPLKKTAGEGSLQSELLAAGGGVGGWDLPDGALWSSSGPKPTPQFRPPQEYYERPPEMGIREYVSKLRELAQSPEHRKGVANAVADLERRLGGYLADDSIGPESRWHKKWSAEDMPHDLRLQTKGQTLAERRQVVAQRTQEYLDYLSAHGVDQRTLDAIASGDLRMDAASRADRAAAMDLDPNAVWYRWDSPLKKEMKGFTGAALSQSNKRRFDKGGMKFVNLQPKSEGLVYTSHNPDYARLGVQVPRDEITLYPLLGPNSGIAGIDRMPPEAYDAFKQRQAAALKAKYPESPERQRIWLRKSHLAENLNPAGDLEDWHDWREHALKRLERVSPESETKSLGGGTYPSFDAAEHRKVYTEPLMAAGAKGTLVSDETGLSTAFTPAGARVLRRADLAPLDVRFRSARNVLQSLMLPTAIAGGAAASQQPGVLSGLAEQR